MLAPGTCMHFHHLPIFSSDVISTGLWPMFLKSHCAQILLEAPFFPCLYFSEVRAWSEGRKKWWQLFWDWLPPATSFRCILIWGVWKESRSANDFTRGVSALEESRRDLSCWYLVTNHLDMNYSLSNGNPYSSSSPKALLWGCRCDGAFISFPYPLPHPCTLIKSPTFFKALHHPLTHIGFPLLHHWVYGPSLGLLMTQHQVTHMNMEISHTVHSLFLYNRIDLNP